MHAAFVPFVQAEDKPITLVLRFFCYKGCRIANGAINNDSNIPTTTRDSIKIPAFCAKLKPLA